MPLKRLEIENFKSYRGKQVVGPFYSFTAVIGPNGSGKSNLMDAISFVLGVKSAQLRSSQLKDLIFRGRKMGGGDEEDGEESEDEEDRGEGTANKASVAAVYEDSRGNEHRFQRSITINGASEYRYNGRVTQYSQYNAKLEQFNILVKAKNFLVFQGDVEAVASQNSKDLSKLIDQISGSLELKEDYERAKAAQERATDNSTFNFNKRRGINSELKQFKEQKSEAEKFERLQREREAHIVQQLIWRLFHIEQEIALSTKSINSQREKLGPLREEHRELESKVNDAKVEQAQAQKEIMQIEKLIKRKEKELEDKRPSLDALDERMAHSQRKVENAQRVREQVQKDLERQSASLSKLEGDYETVKKAADRAAEEQRKALESSGLSLSATDLSDYHELLAEASIVAVSERQQLEGLRRDASIKGDNVRNLEEKIEQLDKQREKLQSELSALTERHSDLDSKRAGIESSLKATRDELTTSQEERDRINQRETKLNDTLLACYNKLMQAGHDQKETEREARMKETFATLQKIFPGVRGRVIDLCKPTQRKYDMAISTVLGRNADAVIVDHEKTAIDCIEYLRNQRSGQATFLPLDTIQVKPINDRLRSIAKGARLALDVIQFDAVIERAIQHACGNALVCDTMEIARYVCYEKKQEVKAVTLEGTIIHKSGLITGGQTAGGAGAKRWEEREVQGLYRQRDECMAELKELQKEKRLTANDDELVARIGRLESELATVKDELGAVNSRLTGVRDELKNNAKQVNGSKPKLNSGRNELQKIQDQMSTLEEVVNAEEDRIFADFCRRIGVDNIREYEERQLKVMQQQDDARLQFDTQLARLKHQSNFEKQQIQNTKDRLDTLERTVTKEEAKIQALQAEKEALQEEVDGVREEIQDMVGQREELSESHDEKKQALERVRGELNKASKALDSVLKEAMGLNDEIEKLGAERTTIYKRCRLEEIDLPLVEGSLDRVPLEEAEREEEEEEKEPMDLDEEEGLLRPVTVPDYGIEVDFTDLDEEEKEDGGASMAKELQDRIETVSSEIEKMTPNMKAVERLDDTEAKLAETEREFEKSRREAKEARDEFNRIKKRRCDLFNKAYNHISEKIDQVYKELTKGRASPMGGVAYLSLEDTEEPYLSGIRYNAMPPMKRFRDIQDLSGGEKSIAALALLLSINSFRPAPFIVLDEVDAALDSQNVARVSNYMRAHASSNTQFIVISLKAPLYERSQSLVGIYRDQQVNSSTSLTLDLEQYA